ncbi:MAG: hypothetical protein ACR2KC_06930 [Acidimicrobiales bacterium]
MTIIEAFLLALVAVLAAWSGFASAKWGTESRLRLASASTTRTQAASAELAALTTRNFDSSTFTAWFVAYVAGDGAKIALAERRFRPEFRVAFDAWLATHPETNPNAPVGPTYMAEYHQPDQLRSERLNAMGDALYSQGSTDGSRSDDYVRITIYLATVLFIVAISSHFALRSARVGLITVGAVVVLFSVSQLLVLAKPPA